MIIRGEQKKKKNDDNGIHFSEQSLVLLWGKQKNTVNTLSDRTPIFSLHLFYNLFLREKTILKSVWSHDASHYLE